MVDRLNAVERVAIDRGQQRLGIDVVVEAQRREVAPLLGSIEPIGDENAIVAALVERPHEGAADEPRGAGHQRRHAQILRQVP